MTHELSAEIIAIGTEILLGELTDTNSVYIARVLRDLGINLYFMTSVGDNEGRIADAIKLALSRAQIVITCGGLGPTVDDMTRQGVARATGHDLVFEQTLLDSIRLRFESFRTPMPENNRRQAFIPKGALIIDNPVGTAPAFAVSTDDGRVVISLPGVPREMKYLLNERIIPYLRENHGVEGQIIKAKLLKAAGIGESALDEAIGETLLNNSNPTIGLAAHSGQIDVRITAKAENVLRADELIAEMETAVRARVGDYIYGTDSDTLEKALADRLNEQGMRLALYQAGIETNITERLGAHTAEMIVRGYDHPDVLWRALNLPVNGGDLPTLLEIAMPQIAAAERTQIVIGIISLPDDRDDHDDSARSTAVAVWCRDTLRVRAYGFGARSEMAQTWTTTWAMATAWQLIKETLKDS